MLDLSSYKFILGAKDPEMNVIEKIADAIKLDYDYAIKNGKRCNPRNAYLMHNKLPEKVVFIECYQDNYSGEAINIDHHKDGDYGYHLDYRKFLEASSIGQFVKLILRSNYAQKIIKEIELTRVILEDFEDEKEYFFQNENWFLNYHGGTVMIPKRIVTLAAVDHCLADAYRGLCLGVDPKTLLNVRLEALGVELNMDYDDVAKIFYKSCNYFFENEDVNGIIDLTHLDLGNGYSKDYLILREAALATNTAIAVKTSNDGDEFKKIMLLSLNENQVSNFLKEKYFNGHHICPLNIFGVPNRGYAGGKIKKIA